MSDWRPNKLSFPLITTILILLDLSAVVLNGLIVHVIKRHKKMRIVAFLFIYCLSISDVMLGVVEMLRQSLLLYSFLNPDRVILTPKSTLPLLVSEFFLALSGRTIFIIAVDRCIHMKYLTRYSMIMTRFRARVIIFINIVFGIVVIIPVLVAQSKLSVWYSISVNVFHAAGTLMICVIYIRTYFSIKRRVATLQLDEGSHIAVKNTSDIRKQCKGKFSNIGNQRGCVNFERCNRIDTNEDNMRCNPSPIEKDNSCIEPKQGIAIRPMTAVASSSNTWCKNMEEKQRYLDFLKNLTVYPDNKARMGTEKPMERGQLTRNQELRNNIAEKSQRRKAKAELEFRKATWMILLSLVICYVPTFIINFYALATKDFLYTYLPISQISLLLNPSLNAFILILCSKDIKGYIKTFFIQCWNREMHI